MKILYPAPAFPNYYDRNPLSRVLKYNSGAIGPHAETSRGQYAVPAKRRAFITATFIHIQRQSAATTARDARAYISLAINSLLAWVDRGDVITNGVYDGVVKALSGTVILSAGDTVDIYTGDDSTGGMVNYLVSVHYVEFDAV